MAKIKNKTKPCQKLLVRTLRQLELLLPLGMKASITNLEITLAVFFYKAKYRHKHMTQPSPTYLFTQENESDVQIKTCVRIFIAALFKITQTGISKMSNKK